MKWPYYVRMHAEAKARKERKLGLQAARLYVESNPHLMMEASSSIILELTGLRAEARASRPAKAMEKVT